VGTRIIEKSVKVSSPKVGLIVADEAASSLRISAVARDSSSTPGAKDEPATLASANSQETRLVRVAGGGNLAEAHGEKSGDLSGSFRVAHSRT